MPRLSARASGPGPADTARVRVIAAKPLSSHTNSTGNSKSLAQLRLSRKGPRFVAPSPKKQTTILRSPLSLSACAAPTAMVSPAATTPFAPSMPTLKSAMWSEPPLPWQVPVARPKQLGHHGGRGGPLGDSVAVTAMRRRDQVFAREMDADPGGDRLLADRKVDGTRDLAGLVRRLGGFLEGADAAHRAVVREQALDIDVGPRHHRSIPHVTRLRAIYSIAL